MRTPPGQVLSNPDQAAEAASQAAEAAVFFGSHPKLIDDFFGSKVWDGEDINLMKAKLFFLRRVA